MRRCIQDILILSTKPVRNCNVRPSQSLYHILDNEIPIIFKIFDILLSDKQYHDCNETWTITKIENACPV